MIKNGLRNKYKMYKSGKNWCFMALATAMTFMGLTMASHKTILADTTLPTASQQSVQNSDNYTEFTVNNNGDDAAADTNVTSTNDQAENNTKVSNLNNDLAVVSKVQTYNQPTTQNGWVKNDNGQMTYY